MLCVVAFVTQEGALPERQDRVGGSSPFIERQSGNTVHQHMVFVSPVKLITAFVVLAGGGMNAQGAVRVDFGMALRLEFVFGKGLRIVLLCVDRNRRRVQANKRGVHNAQLI